MVYMEVNLAWRIFIRWVVDIGSDEIIWYC